MEHAGESGVQPSVGAEMEPYGDQVAVTVNNFAPSLGRSQAGSPVNQMGVYVLMYM